MKAFKDKDKIRTMLVQAFNNGWIKVVDEPGCPVCGRSLMEVQLQPVYLHHRMHDKPGNRKRYPLFIHSPANLVPYHARCQDDENWIDMSDITAELYEMVLNQAVCLIDNDPELSVQELMSYIDSQASMVQLRDRPEFTYHAYYLSVLILMQKYGQKFIG